MQQLRMIQYSEAVYGYEPPKLSHKWNQVRGMRLQTCPTSRRRQRRGVTQSAPLRRVLRKLSYSSALFHTIKVLVQQVRWCHKSESFAQQYFKLLQTSDAVLDSLKSFTSFIGQNQKQPFNHFSVWYFLELFSIYLSSQNNEQYTMP